MSGIIGYGVYVPTYRIKMEEIARVWNDDLNGVAKSLNVKEKSVPGRDEDTITISVAAARRAIKHAGIDPHEIGAVYVGSESHPYAVKPSAVTVAEAVDTGNDLTAADLEFACKAGTAAIQMSMGLVDSNMIKYGLAIGSDTSQGRPGDALEYTASSGGAAYIIGKNGDDVIAEIKQTASYTSDTPDFWRREGAAFPTHAGRFTAAPAYFKHIIGATKLIFERMGMKPQDFKYAVFHQPNGKFPVNVAEQLGFTPEQIAPGLITPLIGNTYSGSSLIGLAAVLDIAEPGDKILMTSFGSGAGSDAFVIEVKPAIKKKRERSMKVMDIITKDKTYIDYSVYLKNRSLIKR